MVLTSLQIGFIGSLQFLQNTKALCFKEAEGYFQDIWEKGRKKEREREEKMDWVMRICFEGKITTLMQILMKHFAYQPKNVEEILLSGSEMHLYPPFTVVVWMFLDY